MSRTKSAKMPGVYSNSGYKGVMRKGSKWGWEFISSTGQMFKNSGYDTATEAAYAHDEAVIKLTGGNGITNQTLGLLKPRDIIKIRDKLTKQEIHSPVTKQRTRNVGASGFKGVRETKSKKNPFNAQITVNGKYVHLGSFPSGESAARAYDAYAIQHLGIDVETNVSLGLLPPLTEPVFNPGKGNVSKDKEETNIVHLNSHSVESERERQIQAARIMMEIEEKEEASKVKATPPVHTKAATPTPTPTPAPAPAPAFTPTAEAVAPTVTPTPEVNIKPVLAPKDIMENALTAMHAAWEAEHHQERGVILDMLNKLGESVTGYQKAVSELIDHGAELEQQIQELRQLLNK